MTDAYLQLVASLRLLIRTPVGGVYTDDDVEVEVTVDDYDGLW